MSCQPITQPGRVGRFGSVFPSLNMAVKRREQALQDYRRLQAKVEKYEEKEKTGPVLAKLHQVLRRVGHGCGPRVLRGKCLLHRGPGHQLPQYTSSTHTPSALTRDTGSANDSCDSQGIAPQAREELRPVREDFEAKNKQLLDEMPRFHNSRLDYFQPSFESLIRAQVKPLPPARTLAQHFPSGHSRGHLSCQPPLPTPEGDLAILCQDSQPPPLPCPGTTPMEARGLWSFAGISVFGSYVALWLMPA